MAINFDPFNLINPVSDVYRTIEVTAKLEDRDVGGERILDVEAITLQTGVNRVPFVDLTIAPFAYTDEEKAMYLDKTIEGAKTPFLQKAFGFLTSISPKNFLLSLAGGDGQDKSNFKASAIDAINLPMTMDTLSNYVFSAKNSDTNLTVTVSTPNNIDSKTIEMKFIATNPEVIISGSSSSIKITGLHPIVLLENLNYSVFKDVIALNGALDVSKFEETINEEHIAAKFEPGLDIMGTLKSVIGKYNLKIPDFQKEVDKKIRLNTGSIEFLEATRDNIQFQRNEVVGVQDALTDLFNSSQAVNNQVPFQDINKEEGGPLQASQLFGYSYFQDTDGRKPAVNAAIVQVLSSMIKQGQSFLKTLVQNIIPLFHLQLRCGFQSHETVVELDNSIKGLVSVEPELQLDILSVKYNISPKDSIPIGEVKMYNKPFSSNPLDGDNKKITLIGEYPIPVAPLPIGIAAVDPSPALSRTVLTPPPSFIMRLFEGLDFKLNLETTTTKKTSEKSQPAATRKALQETSDKSDGDKKTLSGIVKNFYSDWCHVVLEKTKLKDTTAVIQTPYKQSLLEPDFPSVDTNLENPPVVVGRRYQVVAKTQTPSTQGLVGFLNKFGRSEEDLKKTYLFSGYLEQITHTMSVNNTSGNAVTTLHFRHIDKI